MSEVEWSVAPTYAVPSPDKPRSPSQGVLRYNGTTGALIATFVAEGSGGLSTPTYLLFTSPAPSYSAQVQQPINADGTSVFNVRRGVVPVKFTLTQGGVATCALPPATIALTRTAGGTTGAIDESVYTGSADTGSNFRIDSCQYIYNLSSGALGVGTYRVDIKDQRSGCRQRYLPVDVGLYTK
jgi:hypothetical protein